MKSVAMLFTTLVVLSGVLAHNVQSAEAKKSADRFYGKVTSIDLGGKSFSMYNKTRKADAVFAWDEDTQFIANKQPIPANNLKVGDFLMVSYHDENGTKAADKVVVRANFGQRKATQ